MITDGTTFISPLGLGFTLLMGLLVLALPRRYVILPVIMLACYMTMGERVMVAGLNFTMIRILLLFGWLRIIARGEIRSLRLNRIDKVILWWTASGVIAYTALWQSSSGFIYRCGGAYNVIGLYFFFRALLCDMEDIVRVFKMVAICVAPLAAAMILEKATGRNAFAIFGGVPEMTTIRDGVLRCQGSFGHPILAGSFGAATLPLCLALWWQGRGYKILSIVGVLSCLAIVATSGSSGPVLAMMIGVLGLCLWRMRQHTREMRRGLLLLLIALHLVMKAPVWYLIARVDVFNGSTGYHRALLIDRAIINFSDWWLVGTKSTASWASEDDHLFDVTSEYINQGASGGILTMVLFITIITRTFQGVGRTVRRLVDRRQQLSIWALGGALMAHVATFMSVSYFDQNVINWYLLLAMISSATMLYRKQPLVPVLTRDLCLQALRLPTQSPQTKMPDLASA